MNRQTGFTLIELITVIVILGVLAVVALPRYFDLQDDAAQAAVDGVAGSLSAATATNLAGALAGDANAVTLVNCGQAPSALAGGTMPNTDYAVGNPGASLGSATGDTAECTLEYTAASGSTFSATFNGYNVPDAP